MKTKIAIALLAALPMLAMAGEYTTTATYGQIKGKRVMATATVSDMFEEVYTTPATGQFFITQFCSISATQPMQLEGMVIGYIAELQPGTTCISFPEPVAIPANTTLRCWSGVPQRCSLFGILSK